MEYNNYMNNELRHHGILGMKWGVRRYQNKDGSLTPKGKKHRATLEVKDSKKSSVKTTGGKPRGTAKAAVKKPTKPEVTKPKTVSEMTDDEVRNATNRMRMETEYYNARRQLAAANPRQVSTGERFMKSLTYDVIAPAARDAGRKWLTNFMEDKLGLNKKSTVQRLEEEWKKLDYKKKISDLKKGIDDNDNEESKELTKLERQAKRAKSEYEIADYTHKRDNVGKTVEDFNLDDALAYYRNLSPEERKDIDEASKVFEKIHRIRGKQKNN